MTGTQFKQALEEMAHGLPALRRAVGDDARFYRCVGERVDAVQKLAQDFEDMYALTSRLEAAFRELGLIGPESKRITNRPEAE